MHEKVELARSNVVQETGRKGREAESKELIKAGDKLVGDRLVRMT